MPETGPHHFKMEQWISCAPFERLLNMTIKAADQGKAVLCMPFILDLAQGAGLMHGGALVSLADTACCMAVKSLLPPQAHFATIDMQSRFLHPVTQGVVTARAEVLGREDRCLETEATVYNEEDRPVMRFNATFKVARESRL